METPCGVEDSVCTQCEGMGRRACVVKGGKALVVKCTRDEGIAKRFVGMGRACGVKGWE